MYYTVKLWVSEALVHRPGLFGTPEEIVSPDEEFDYLNPSHTQQSELAIAVALQANALRAFSVPTYISISGPTTTTCETMSGGVRTADTSSRPTMT